MSTPVVSNSPKSPLEFPVRDRAWIDPYLPPKTQATRSSHDPELSASSRPYLTLTYATSLDAALTGIPGQQTWISGPESTAMTHYLRSAHDAILVGVGTALAANPSLNCRLKQPSSTADPNHPVPDSSESHQRHQQEGEQAQPPARQHHPRPIIIDPTNKLPLDPRTSNVLSTAIRSQGLPPWIITSTPPSDAARDLLTSLGGEYIVLSPAGRPNTHLIPWTDILQTLASKGIASLMVEGGAQVINTLLHPTHKALVDAVVVTVAPLWLGQGSVVASPDRQGVDARNTFAELDEVSWNPLGRDVVLCGKVRKS